MTTQTKHTLETLLASRNTDPNPAPVRVERSAADAIERSSSHNEIVTIDYDASGYEDLLVQCDDSVATDDVTEFWANDPDDENGMLWRVHMRHAPDDAGDRELTER